MIAINDLLECVKTYNHGSIDLIKKAYEFMKNKSKKGILFWKNMIKNIIR